jgi:hypothetical protein
MPSSEAVDDDVDDQLTSRTRRANEKSYRVIHRGSESLLTIQRVSRKMVNIALCRSGHRLAVRTPDGKFLGG